jgi:hypothetical protein
MTADLPVAILPVRPMITLSGHRLLTRLFLPFIHQILQLLFGSGIFYAQALHLVKSLFFAGPLQLLAQMVQGRVQPGNFPFNFSQPFGPLLFKTAVGVDFFRSLIQSFSLIGSCNIC